MLGLVLPVLLVLPLLVLPLLLPSRHRVLPACCSLPLRLEQQLQRSARLLRVRPLDTKGASSSTDSHTRPQLVHLEPKKKKGVFAKVVSTMVLEGLFVLNLTKEQSTKPSQLNYTKKRRCTLPCSQQQDFQM
jgi:hypothetical protein